MAALVELVSAALLVIGALFTALAAVGIIRLPDLYTRMHAASKVGTVGSCLMLIALAVQAGDMSVALRAVVAVAFFLLTAPVAAHLLARASYAAGYGLWEGSVRDEMGEAFEQSEETAEKGAE